MYGTFKCSGPKWHFNDPFLLVSATSPRRVYRKRKPGSGSPGSWVAGTQPLACPKLGTTPPTLVGSMRLGPGATLTQAETDGGPMLEHDTYLQLARLNGLIVETRELIRRQKVVVLAVADLPEGEDAVLGLRGLQGSLRELTYRRNMLVRQLIGSQFRRVAGTVAHLHSDSARIPQDLLS